MENMTIENITLNEAMQVYRENGTKIVFKNGKPFDEKTGKYKKIKEPRICGNSQLALLKA